MTTRCSALARAMPCALREADAGNGLADRLRELPTTDPSLGLGAAGYVRQVRYLVVLPLTVLGVLAMFAGVATGSTTFALAAAISTVLVVRSLVGDTRLSRSIVRMQEGDLEGAQAGFLHVVDTHAPGRQERRWACACLAEIAWRRGDHDAALRWTQRAIHDLGPKRNGRSRSDRGGADEFLLRATEVQLLALTGAVEAATPSLAKLQIPERDDYARLVGIATELVVALAADAPDRIWSRLEGWEPLVCRLDEGGATCALLAWGFDTRGDKDRAQMLVSRLTPSTRAHVEHHYPRLASWLRPSRPRRY